MKCLLLLAALLQGATSAESVYMKRSEIEDQESSASGYAYQLHSGGPLSYAAPLGGFNRFAYPPLALGGYTQELPLQLPLEEYKPQAALGVYPLNSYGLQPHPYALNAVPLQTPTLRYDNDPG
jgi:hypothetical protein